MQADAAVFSPSLTYSCFGVYDGHLGGPSTAATLKGHLTQVLKLALADLYSHHSRISSKTGVDIASGYSFQERPQSKDPNVGKPQNPKPPGNEIDAVIKGVFVALDNALVHRAAQYALGLSQTEYDALQGSRGNHQQTTSPSNLEFMKHIEELYAQVLIPKASSSKPSRAEAVNALANAYAGSCAVVAIYNNYERNLRVALTGDCRAVLGRRVPIEDASKGTSGAFATNNDHRYVYEVHKLTADHSPKNPTEAARVKSLHPDEPDLLKNDRYLGWGPTRAFGDGVMKWSIAIQTRLWEECLGDRPRKQEIYKTPPYFTAEPEITTFEDVRRGDFLILASDGLWDCLESEEVVGLVGKWLEENGKTEVIKVAGKGETEIILPTNLAVQKEGPIKVQGEREKGGTVRPK